MYTPCKSKFCYIKVGFKGVKIIQVCFRDVVTILTNFTDDFKTTTSCTVTLLPKDWDPTTNQAVVKFEVLAERDFKHDRDKNLVLHFSRVFSVDSPPVFNNYQIPYLQVSVKYNVQSSKQEKYDFRLWSGPSFSSFSSCFTGSLPFP